MNKQTKPILKIVNAKEQNNMGKENRNNQTE